LDIVQSPQGYTFCFLNFVTGVVCDMQDLYSQIPCQNSILLVPPIVFSFRANPYFIWGPYAAEHGMVLIWKYRIEGSIFTAIYTPSFWMDRNYTVYWFQYCVALNPGLGGVGRTMHFHYCPWTGSIIPSLQYFHICRVWRLSKFPFHLILQV
jgi:hypothetical protein